ncbi:Bromodomain protein [Kalmanozyma brasiliensis GHG001]|uniref:Bromo domain-containing protein n=1 Tax=Kalmanozyma brasiliensis (strain GHG001) TaxID=1365824 RepID=V5EHV8_KALBG|nr:Bromodomain protein [Kalmanozyma brasiliensis GHG001]EST10186.1 Bromodomain protein [Kalmanozyma brasiliensis GHG001]
MNPMIPSPHALQPSALAKLSLRDKLLLAQAVHEIGTSPPDWGRVSSLLLAHPLVRQQSRLEQAANAGLTLGRIFGTRECERAWIALMRQRGLVLGKDEVVPEPVTPTTPKPKEARGLQPRTDRRSQLALAQLLYAERLEELKEQIKEKEEQFKSLVKEIDEIKSGKADARLEMELRIEMENLANGPPLPPSTPGSTAASIAGPTTPASTASTTPKSAKKGRARGESSATLPQGDLSKGSPASTGTGSAPNSAGKKSELVKGRKPGERRSSIDESPTKLVPGPTTLPSTPSINLPRPATEAVAASSAAVNGDSSTANKAGDAMTTEEAEQAVADAATEAAVKVLQDEKAAGKILQAEVEKAAEQVIDLETNMELSAQAEGNADAAVASTSTAEAQSSTTEAATAAAAAEAQKDAATQPHEAPAADVVVKEKEPVQTASVTAQPASETPVAAAKSAESIAGANKRKREESTESPKKDAPAAGAGTAAKSTAADSASPVKKSRTAEAEKVPSSDVEMDSEDEAEAAVGADEAKAVAGDASKAAAPSKDVAPVADQKADADKEAVMDEDADESSDEEETEEQVKSVESSRKRSPTKEDVTAAPSSSPVEPEEVDESASDDEQKPSSRRKPLRPRLSSTHSTRPPKPTPPGASSDRQTAAAKRKTAQVLSMLLTEVSNHTHGNLFHAPIKEQDAPDYYTLIKHPLDIKTIKARIKEGSIASAKQLRRSLALMFANSLMYNRPGTEVHRMASEMFAASEEIFKRYEGTQRF